MGLSKQEQQEKIREHNKSIPVVKTVKRLVNGVIVVLTKRANRKFNKNNHKNAVIYLGQSRS